MVLELYIGEKKADIPDNFTVNFTYKETEVSKPTAIKNSFSKTIVLDGTPANNSIFSSIYRLDKIQNETDFDPNKRTDFKILKNGDIVESGYLQLDSISNNGGNIKYSCTLYGGLGSFFYNLQTNEDGSEKTLADLYYKILKDNGDVYSKEEEKNAILLNWDSDYILDTWRNLSGVHSSWWNTSVKANITAAPTYSGLYGDDFDSQHVLVNLYDMPSSIKSLFPSAYTENNETYTPYLDPNSGYTVVQVSRDLSEFEARDLRSMYQRRAIRNKFIMRAICDPVNNGGYSVVIDDEILNSHYYEDTYLLLDRFDTSKIQNSSVPNYVPVNYSGARLYNNDKIDADIYKTDGSSGNHYYNFSGLTSPVLDFNFDFYVRDNVDASKLYSVFECKYGYQRIDTVYSGFLVRIDCMKYGAVDTAYTCTKDYIFTTGGFDASDAYFQSGLTKYVNYLNDTYSSSEKHTYSKDNIIFKTFELVKDTEGDYGDNIGYKIINPISLQLRDMPTNVSNLKLILRIKRFNIVKVYQMNGGYSNWKTTVGVTSTAPRFATTQSVSNGSGFTTDIVFKRIEEPVSSYHDESVNPALSYIEVTKDLLFSDTKSPYKYLTDFARMFNAKFEIDNYSKRVYIRLLKNFYQNEVVDISQRIDRSREFKITPTIAKTKWCSYALETPETYASYLYGLKNKIEYGGIMVNTTYDFNTEVQNLLEDSVYKNTVPFRLSSYYFNVIKSSNVAIPTCIQQPIYNVTLYKSVLNDVKHLEKPQNLSSSLLTYYGNSEYDFQYKICCFDKDNNNVSDLNSSLVFFSGWDVLPFSYSLSDNSAYMDLLNGKPCYLYSYSAYDATENVVARITNVMPRFSKYYDIKDVYYEGQINTAHTDTIQASLDFAMPTQTFISDPASYDASTTIYYQYWRYYIDDLYDKNNKQVTCYVFLKDKPQDALKKFYFFDNSIWVLNEITNYDINNTQKPTKCTFIKVKNKNNYLTR